MRFILNQTRNQNSVSQTVHHPKLVRNRKYLQDSKDRAGDESNMHDVEKLIQLIKSDTLVRTLTFERNCYSTVNIVPHM